MKAMATGFAAMIVIALGAYFTLNNMGFGVDQVYSSPSVRLE